MKDVETQVWESVYRDGRHLNQYPWDDVVTFLYRHALADSSRSNTSVLEVGCGSGSNLWFAAREGLTVAGVDISPTAIAYARERFEAESLVGDLQVGDMINLPHADQSFHLAIDRASISCLSINDGVRALMELHRVLIRGGRLLFTPYSVESLALPPKQPGTRTTTPVGGRLAGVGPLTFYDLNGILDLAASGWTIDSLSHIEDRLIDKAGDDVVAYWRMVLERI